ncbi:cytochrome P450 [Apiospora phragmitis]|uniref:Cytochrome P450 n=1 Tax=Apiospora phragmitis TaxID=2905665 RepID=A0ABR1T6U6_9PEZI
MEVLPAVFTYHVLAGTVALLLVLVTWRRYWAPISHIPGPFTASFTRLWHMHRILKGDQNTELIRLHEKHGYFVRISFDGVSVSHPDAIKKVLLAPLEKVRLPLFPKHWAISHLSLITYQHPLGMFGTKGERTLYESNSQRTRIRSIGLAQTLAIPDYRFQSAMSTTDPKQKRGRSRRLAPGYALSNVIKSELAIDKTVIGEVTFSRKFGFLEQGIDVGNSISSSLALNAYIAVAAFLRWLHVALLANPIVTWLAILPMGHLLNTTKKAVSERQHSTDARWDILASWLQQMRQYPDQMDMKTNHTQERD